MVRPLFDVPDREQIRTLVLRDQEERQRKAAMPEVKVEAPPPAPVARNPRSENPGPLTVALNNVASSVGSAIGEAYQSWGVLTPEEQEAEQAQRREEARQAELTNKLLAEQDAAARAEIAKAGYEMPGQFETMGDRNVEALKEKAEGPPPTLSKARSGSDAFLRTLAQSTLSVAQAPGVVADSIDYLATGDEQESTYVRKLGEVSEAIRTALPGDPTRNGELFEGLAQGTGSLTSIMVGGLATKVIGLGVKTGSTVVGVTAGGVGGYDDAKAHNATTTAKYLSFYANSALGLTERIPIANAIDRAFGELNKATNGRVVDILASGTVNSLEELIQELGQGVGQNVIAKVLYDKEREIFEGVADQATVGGILGFFFGAGTTALSQAMNRPAAEPVQPYQPAPRVEPTLIPEPPMTFEEIQQQFDAIIPADNGETRPGIRVFRGSPEAETAPQARDFAGVFTSTDRASAGQYGQVTEYDLPEGTQLLDMNEVDDPSSNAAGMVRAYLVGQNMAVPEDPAEFSRMASELHAGLAGELDPDVIDGWPGFVKSLGFQGTKDGPDILVYDPALLRPTQTAAPRQTDTPEFRNWFGESKVVDESGAPLVVYHGTDQDFDTFDPSKSSPGAAFGPGIYLTEDRANTDWKRGDGANVMPVFVAVKNPLDIRTTLTAEEASALQAIGIQSAKEGAPAPMTTMERLFGSVGEAAKAAGFDGLLHYGPNGKRHILAFDPTQIKSATGNRGTFDPNDPSIEAMTATQDEPVEPAFADSPDRISTRQPYAKKTTENAIKQNLIVDYEIAKRDTKAFEKNVGLIRDYVNLRPVEGETLEQTAERFIQEMVDNLLWLHDQVPADTRVRSKRWYDGANAIAGRLGQRYGLPPRAVAGALAALSPQKDWFQNVSLAERVLDIVKTHANHVWDARMEETAARIFGKEQYAPAVAEIRGKAYRELTDPVLKAMWVRAFDEAHNDRAFRAVSPEGQFLDWVRTQKGEKTSVAWGSSVEISKAILAIENGQRSFISQIMGFKHKVRNFYNNIIAPGADHGDVTIDTHAVAAALLRPLSGKSIEVAHVLATSVQAGQPNSASSAATGLEGTYSIFAEAYRRAAKQRGIRAREMQSITWEAVRGLYAAKFKNAKNVAAIDEIWNRYHNGEIDVEQARKELLTKAGGIEQPSWLGPAGRVPEGAEDTSYARELSGVGIPGRVAEGVGGGTGSGTPAGNPDVEAVIPRQAGVSLSGEPQRPSTGIPDTGTAQEQIALSAMSGALVRLMNLTFRTGRLTAGKDALAQYSRKTGVIRARQRNDFSTLVHESGHALNDSRSAELNTVINRHQNEVSQVALRHYGAPQKLNAAQLKREGFAEFFRFYVTNPQLAQQEAPRFFQEFDQIIKAADPNLHKGLQLLTRQFKTYAEAYPSTDVVKSFVKSARQKNLWDPRDLAEVVAEESQNARPYEGRPTAGGFFDWVRRGAFDMASQAYTALVDQNNGVRKMTYALLNVAERNNKNVDLKDADNPLELLAKASNSFMPAQLALQYGVRSYKTAAVSGPALRDGIAVMMGASKGASYFDMNEQRMADANAYLVALRAVEEYQRYAAGEIQNPPVGFSEADARQAVRDLEAKYGQDFIDGAKLVHRYARALLDREFEAGLITPETYDDIKDKPNYVPLLRDMSDKNQEFGDNVLTSGKASLIKRFRGSSRDIIAPLDALMHRTFASEKRIAENETIRAMSKLAQKAGVGAGAIVEKISAAEVERIQLQMEDVFQKIIDDPNISPADAAIMQGIFQASFGGDEVMQIFRPTMLNERGERILTYRENGKLQAIQLGDDGVGESVFNVMRGLGNDKVPLLLDLASKPSRALRFGITKWPDFLLVNYFRDQFMAGVSTNVGYVPFASGAKGMWDVVRKKKAFLDYSDAMGIMGGVAEYQVHKARVAQDIEGLKQKGYVVETFEFDGFSYKTLGGLVKGVFRLSELAEAGTRVGLFSNAYKRAVGEGLSEYDAIQEASRIARDYIDFGRAGSKMAAANRLIPFLNANIQGLDITIRKLTGGGAVGRKALAFMDENRTAPRLQAFVKTITAITDGQRQGLNLSRVELNDLKNAQAMWIKMTGLALMSAAIAFAFKDDEDYQETSEYLRQTGWIIPLGDGRVFYAPKPFEIALLGNFMERAIEYAYGDEAALGKFWDNFTGAVTPPFIPPAVSLGVGLGANLDISFGKPREVVPGYLERLPPEQRYLATTSEVAKKIGEAIGYPPAKINFLITSLFGSMGRDVSSALDGVINPERAEKGVDDSFITRRFVRDATRGGMSSQDFNVLANRMNGAMTQASAGYKRYVDIGDTIGAAEYLASLTEDERAWAILDRHFEAKLKRLHPIYRANQISTIVSGVRREVLTTQLKDSENEGEFIPLTAKQKRLVDDFVTDIQRRERRNALIAIEHPSWKSKQPLDIQPSIELLREVSPEAADEFERRLERAKIYDGAEIAQSWPELKQRLLSEGEEAFLNDLIP